MAKKWTKDSRCSETFRSISVPGDFPLATQMSFFDTGCWERRTKTMCFEETDLVLIERAKFSSSEQHLLFQQRFELDIVF